jgi:nucleoside-diphosphate-sugar epimerase
MMRVLVTGAAGFVGSHIAAHLARQGFDVLAGHRSALLPSWLEQLPHVEPRRIELNDVLERVDIDAIVHAAATSPSPGISADRILRDGAEATRNLLEFASATGARRIVYLSSLSVFGRIEVDRVDEATPVCDPDLYGASKLAGEVLVEAACTSDGGLAAGLSIRLPGVLGAGAARNWLSRVAADLAAGQEVRIYNPEAPFNNAAHVADLAPMVARMLTADWKGYDRVTVAAGSETTVRGAVTRLAAAIRSRSPIVVGTALRRSFTVSSDRACARHQYNPMTIEQMLDRFGDETLQSYRMGTDRHAG